MKLRELVDVRSDVRRLRQKALGLPLLAEAERLHERHASLVADPCVRQRLEAILFDALSAVAHVKIRAHTGRVHAEVTLKGKHETTPLHDAAEHVVKLLEEAFQPELLGILILEVRNQTGWGPLASIDHYAGRPTDRADQPICF